MSSSEFRTWFVWCVWAGAVNVAALLSYFSTITPPPPPPPPPTSPPEVYFTVAMGEIRLGASDSNRIVTVTAHLSRECDKAITIPVQVEGGSAGETRQLAFAVKATTAEIVVGTFPAPLEDEPGKRLVLKLTPSTNDSYLLPKDDLAKPTEIPIVIEGRSRIPVVTMITPPFKLKSDNRERRIKLEASLDIKPERDMIIAFLIRNDLRDDAKLNIDFKVIGPLEFEFKQGDPKSAIYLDVNTPDKNTDTKSIRVRILEMPSDSLIAYKVSPNRKDAIVEIQAMPRAWAITLKSDPADDNGKVLITATIDTVRDMDTDLPFKVVSKGEEGKAYDAIPEKWVTIPKGKFRGEREFAFRDTSDLSLPPEVEVVFQADDSALTLKPEPKLSLKWVPDDSNRDLLVLIPYTAEMKSEDAQKELKKKMSDAMLKHRNRLIGGRVYLLPVPKKPGGTPDKEALGEVWKRGGWNVFADDFPKFEGDLEEYTFGKYRPQDVLFASIAARNEILKRVSTRNGGKKLCTFVFWRSNRTPDEHDGQSGMYSNANTPKPDLIPSTPGADKAGYYFVWVKGENGGTKIDSDVINRWTSKVVNPGSNPAIQFHKMWDECFVVFESILGKFDKAQ